MYNLEVSVSVLITRKGEIDGSDYPQKRETDKFFTYIRFSALHDSNSQARFHIIATLSAKPRAGGAFGVEGMQWHDSVEVVRNLYDGRELAQIGTKKAAKLMAA